MQMIRTEQNINIFFQTVSIAITQYKINIESFIPDHICWRTECIDEYIQTNEIINKQANLLSEAEINGRMISTYQLQNPILYKRYSIDCLEIPAPKVGSHYKSGFEHIEFVINMSLEKLLESYPDIPRDISNIHHPYNPDVSFKYQGISVKFHLHTLPYVITHFQ